MEFRHLRYFLAVAEELHFRRAAQRLHLAQPALSQQIKDLEIELGTPLFERSSRRVELTEAGRILLRETRTIFHQLNRTLELVKAAGSADSARLKIGFITSASYTILPNLLRAYNLARPQVELQCVEMHAAPQLESLRKGDIDAGLIRLPIEEQGIVIHTLMSEPMVMILPRQHRAAHQPTVTLQDFASDPFILFPRVKAPGAYDLILENCRKAGFSPTIANESQDLQSIFGMVSAGFGVSIGPSSLQSMQRPDIIYKLLDRKFGSFELGLAIKQGPVTENLKAFIEQAQQITRFPHQAIPREKRTGDPANRPKTWRGSRAQGENRTPSAQTTGSDSAPPTHTPRHESVAE